ncbi:MAG: tyrosine-type recombinase/integrase [Bacillota bacterium]
MRSVLRSALEQAVKWRVLPQNPAQMVDLPRQRREELRPLSPEEARACFSAAHGTRYGTLFELLLTAGLRPGEALGLKWTDVDLAAGRLPVQRTLTTYRSKEKGNTVSEWRLEEPKTSQAGELPPFPASFHSLRQHRKHQLEERLRAGQGWQDRACLCRP